MYDLTSGIKFLTMATILRGGVVIMKNKKNFIKFRGPSSKIISYLEKNGFYIVALLCILVIGATVAIVSLRDYSSIDMDYALQDDTINKDLKGQNLKDVKTQAPANNDSISVQKAVNTKPDIEKTEAETEKQEKKIEEPKKQETKIMSNTNTAKKVSNETKHPEEEKLTLNYPVYGKIINKYAMDELIFSKTLQQWTTHSGVDISSSKGTPVKAAMDGVVKSIKNDPRYGITIIIEHEGGLSTIYSNLSSASMVKPGKEVKRGTVISGVGSTANFECEEADHLHFEVLKDGRNVNPENYLPAMK